MTHDEVQRLLGVIKTNWPERFPIEPLTVKLWHRYLADVDAVVAERAVFEIIGTAKHPPVVAEVLDAIARPIDGDEPTAEDEWGEVTRAISRCGRDREPTFEHPVTARIVAGLGWRDLCNSENQTADRARFLDGWNEAIVSHRRRAAMAPVRMPTSRQLETGPAPSALPDPTKRASRCTTSTSIDHPQGGQLGVTCEGGAGHQGHHHATVRGERVAWDANGWRVK